MKKKIKHIATIQHGLYQKTDTKGDILYIQSRDFENNILLPDTNKTFISSNPKTSKYILTEGDILLASKGVKTFAWKYKSNVGMAVASSTFFVISVTAENILPDYLTEILNHSKTLRYFNALSVGSNIKTINKGVLLDFEIPILPVTEQQKLIDFLNNWEKEKQLTNKLIEKKERLYQSVFLKKIENKV